LSPCVKGTKRLMCYLAAKHVLAGALLLLQLRRGPDAWEVVDDGSGGRHLADSGRAARQPTETRAT
jgi:hypothetical protein